MQDVRHATEGEAAPVVGMMAAAPTEEPQAEAQAQPAQPGEEESSPPPVTLESPSPVVMKETSLPAPSTGKSWAAPAPPEPYGEVTEVASGPPEPLTVHPPPHHTGANGTLDVSPKESIHESSEAAESGPEGQTGAPLESSQGSSTRPSPEEPPPAHHNPRPYHNPLPRPPGHQGPPLRHPPHQGPPMARPPLHGAPMGPPVPQMPPMMAARQMPRMGYRPPHPGPPMVLPPPQPPSQRHPVLPVVPPPPLHTLPPPHPLPPEERPPHEEEVPVYEAEGATGYQAEGTVSYRGQVRHQRRQPGPLRISKWVNPIPPDPDDGQQQVGEQELATKMLQIQSKRFYIDVKQNRRGRFMKVAEIGADGRRNQVFLALSTAAEFRDHLSLFSDFYANLGPPNPDTLPEDGKLKSETMVKDNRRYYLDLKENSRGRFLRVSQTIARGGPRCQIAIPAQGMIEFRDALQELLDEFGTDDGGYKGELPEGRHMRVENKNFYFDIGQNNRGIYMRISEVKTNFRTAITIPEKSWSRFRDIFADYVDKMKDGGEKGPSESNK
ncbi:uncharacterized protein Pur-alpha isoform X2 [Panulirus ornatus]|uniref:uncharacterized protein Pur-alpha isoform X2 n=1 Tax=Panulirus ornatus TaxID=150431 RepID=UPI003A8C8327